MTYDRSTERGEVDQRAEIDERVVSLPDERVESLPIDSDLPEEAVEFDRGRRPAPGLPRPIHLRLSAVVLVFVGGAVGTVARDLLSQALSGSRGVPWGILVINAVGALALGLLIEALARGGPDVGVRRAVRLCLGTGLCGGFTTYSTFAVGADGLFADAAIGLGIAYSAATVILGAVATVAGMSLGALRSRSRAA